MTDCNHQWIPIEWAAGKRVYQDDKVYKDWTSNFFNCHYLRVTKIYCPKCGKQQEVATDARDS
jgi:hypothetical protein